MYDAYAGSSSNLRLMTSSVKRRKGSETLMHRVALAVAIFLRHTKNPLWSPCSGHEFWCIVCAQQQQQCSMPWTIPRDPPTAMYTQEHFIMSSSSIAALQAGLGLLTAKPCHGSRPTSKNSRV